MKVYAISLGIARPADVIVFTKGVVWARGDDGLYYSWPHYSYGKTLLKLSTMPKMLTIFSTGEITDYEVHEFSKGRRWFNL